MKITKIAASVLTVSILAISSPAWAGKPTASRTSGTMPASIKGYDKMSRATVARKILAAAFVQTFSKSPQSFDQAPNKPGYVDPGSKSGVDNSEDGGKDAVAE